MKKDFSRGNNWMRKPLGKILSAAVFTGCVAFNPVTANAVVPVLDTLSTSQIPGTTKNYPASLYKFTEVTPSDTNNLAPNIIRYYNPNIDENIHYYSVDFKNSEIGTGNEFKYFKWAKDSNGIKLVECSESEAVLKINYNSSAEIAKILNPADSTYSQDIENIYVGQSIKNAIANKGTMVNVSSRFVGNTMDVVSGDGYNYSAVLSEADARINNVNSSFIGNKVNITSNPGYGTMVKALGTIDNLKSEFIGNTVVTNSYLSGAIVQAPSSGKIGTIQSDFIDNSAFSTDTAIEGVALGNSGDVGTVVDSLFMGNYGVSQSGNIYGAAIYNSGNISEGINNTIFTDNYLISDSGVAYGGAIYNTLNAKIVNSSFMGNYVKTSSGKALGGAIYTDTDLTIAANNGKTSEFTGNYIQTGDSVTNQAIYVNSSDATLTLKAESNGKIVLNDIIDGKSGYRTLIIGDGSGNIILNNDINKSNVVAENININVGNGQIRQTEFLSLNADNTAKWTIDIDFIGNRVDSFELGELSGGVLYIDKFNNIGSSKIPTTGKILQVLSNAPDTITLALSDALINEYHKEWETDNFDTADEVDRNSKWSDIYYTQTQKTEVEEGIRVAKTSSSRTNPDSIEYYINENTIDIGDKRKTGDTLRLLNEMSGARTFSANSADQTYNVEEDLGSTNTGSISVSGLIDSENNAISRLNAGTHTLFELDKSGANLTLRDVYVTSDVTSNGAILNITDSGAKAYIIGSSSDLPTTIKTASGVNGIYNDGSVQFTGSGEVDILTNVRGNGSFDVQSGKVVVDEGASIEQNSVTTANGGTTLYFGDNSTLKANNIGVGTNSALSIVSDNLLSDATITGNGAKLELRGGTLSHVISQTAGTNGGVYIAGDVAVEHGEGENIKGQLPNIFFTNNSSLTTNASDITGKIAAASGLDKSTASMTLNGGTLAGDVAMDKNFVININGEVTYGSSTTNGVVAKTVIPVGSTLNAGLNLSNSGAVANNGTLNLSSTGTTTNTVPTITGTGTTNISNTISAASITQNIINIAEGAKLISPNSSTFKATTIVNDGILNLQGHGRTISQANNGISEIIGSVIGQDNEGKPIYKDTGIVTFGNGSSSYYINLMDVKISQPMQVLNNHTLSVYNLDSLNNEVTVNTGAVLATNVAGTLNQNVKGAGTLTVSTGTLTNNADISTKININSSRALTTDASKVHKAINDAGTLTLNSSKNSNGDGSSTFKLDDTAAVTGAGAVKIAQGANVILESALQNTGAKTVSKDATLTSSASLLTNGNVDLNNEGAKLNLTGGNILVQINGAQNGELHITGDVKDEAKNIGAKVVVDEGGTLRASSNLLANSRDTIDNYGKYYTNGDLTRAITKDGTTYIDGVLNFSDNAEIEGTLNLNNGGLDIYGTTANYNVGKAVGEGSLYLDLDTHNNTATTLTLGSESDAVFHLAGINSKAVYGDYAAGHTSGIIQILKGGSNATLALNHRLNIWDTDSSEEVVGDVTPNVYFDDEYYARERNFWIEGYVDLATTDKEYDSIEWVITEEREEVSDLERKDLLSSWNQTIFDPSGDENKTFSFRTSNNRYDSLKSVGKTTGKNVSVIGVADANNTVTYKKAEASTYNQAQKSAIDLKEHSGFELGENTVFNVSDTTFTGGKDFVIQSNGATFGNIDDEHNVTGGIVNTDFVGAETEISSSGVETGGVVYIGDNSTVSQIKDVIVKDAKLSFTGEDLANSSPEGRLGAIYIGNGAKVGETYTDAEGKKVNVGGILNTVVDGTVGAINEANGVTAKTNTTSGLVINGANISTIKDSIITNNTTTADSTAIIRGVAITMLGGSIDTLENVEISNNIANAGNQNIYGGAMYIGGSINTIKSSKFVNNRAESTGSSVLGGAFELTGTSTIITLIDDTLFDNNFARTHGGAIYDNATIKTIQNSTFTNNSTNGEGGAIRVGAGHYIDTITGSTFEGNTAKLHGGAIRMAGSSSAAGGLTNIYDLNDTIFKNNNVINNGTTASDTGYGGAISASNTHLASGYTSINWSDLTFEKNSVQTKNGTANGGAVYFSSGSAVHDIKDSTFKENYAYASKNWVYGGAIFQHKGIRSIDNVTFDGNYAISGSGKAYGGAIYLNTGDTISSIKDSVFKNNHTKGGEADGGAIHMAGTSVNTKIGKIENTLFENNYTEATTSYALGGAILKDNGTSIGSIVNSRFIGNHVKGASASYAYGGAIHSIAGNLNIIADNGLTEFTGNYREYGTTKDDLAICMSQATNTATPVLTLQSKGEKGHFLLNDRISGTSGYQTKLLGDGVGKFSLFNNIALSNITTDNTNITTINNTKDTKEGLATLFDYKFLSLTTDENTKWNLDIDFSKDVKKSDNFTLTKASSGTMYIDSLNVLNDATERTKVQVLKTINDNIQLKLNENKLHIVTDLVDNLGDTVYDNSNYVQEEGYALSTTDTTNDSILRLVEEKFDNLDLITSSVTNDERSFIFNTNNAYKASVDLKDAGAGTLTIAGKTEGSVIDGDEHSLFNLADETALVINDTKLTNGKDNTVINVANQNASITLNNATIDGDITATEKYTITVDGRNTTQFTGNVEKADTTLNRGELRFAENTFAEVNNKLNLVDGSVNFTDTKTNDYVINELVSSEDVNFTINLDLSGKTADTIETNTADSNGTVYISAINYLNSHEDVTSFETQVLNNTFDNNNLQLKLSDNLAAHKIKDVTKDINDTVKAVSGFNENYYVRTILGERMSSVYLTTTATQNDTLGFKTEDIWDNNSITIKEKLGDTLVLVNAADYDERTFQSTSASDNYRLSDDLGTTSGEFSLKGVTDENGGQSTINLQDHEGFSLDDDAVLNVDNVRLRNAKDDDVITVDGQNADVNLNNATIEGNIVGSKKYDLNISGQGTTTITGSVKNADATLSKGTLVVGTDTFASDDTTLTISNGIVDMANGQLEEYKFSNLVSGSDSIGYNALYNIDVDLSTMTADKIIADGSGVITLAYFNITGILADADATQEYRIKILDTNSSNLRLELTETTQSQLDKDYKLGTNHAIVDIDEAAVATKWNDKLYIWAQDSEVWGRLDIDDENHDSLIFSHLKNIAGTPYKSGLGDTLKIWNQTDFGTDNDKKTFTFDAADNVYSVSENLGTSVGTKLDLIGKTGVDSENKPINSTIDMNEKSGFVLADETELTATNITFTDLNGEDGGLFNITNNKAVLNLNNVNIEQEVQKDAITNAGTVNMTGGKVNLQTGISGTGNTNVKGGADVKLADNYSITQTSVDVQNGTLTMGANGKIKANLSIQEQGNVFVGVDGVTTAVANDGNITFNTSGNLTKNVTGKGTTHIAGDIVNEAKINQNVDVKQGARLDSHTDNLGGGINNDGDLNLKGQIAQVITGGGKTTVNESLNLFDGAGVNGTLDLNNGSVSSIDDKISNFEIGKLLNSGSFGIDVDAQSKTSDKYIVGSESDATINIDDIRFKNLNTVTEDFKTQITQGSEDVQVKLSDAIKAVDYQLGRTSRNEQDDIKVVTKYDELYHKYLRGGDLYGNLVEANTVYDYDSIKMQIDESKTHWDSDRTENGVMGDTLNLWNTYTPSPADTSKQFVYDKALAYTWGAGATGAGQTHGTNVTLQGVSSSETTKSSIDFTGKTGFELVDATTFNVNDMRLKGGNVVEVSNSGAKINIKDSYIEGNIVSSASPTQSAPVYNVEISGDSTTTLRGTFENANTTLTKGNLKLNTNTFAHSKDTLAANGGTIILNNGTIEDYVINELTSSTNAKYDIDINLGAKTADTIAVTKGNGIVTLENLNIMSNAENVDKTYIVQILKVQDGDLQLALSDAVQQQLSEQPGSPYKIGESQEYTQEALKQTTNWKEIYDKYRQTTETYGTLQLATKDTTNDSIGIKVSDTRILDRETIGDQGDTLKVVNQSDEIADKVFEFDTKDDVYTVRDNENLGVTSGAVTVKGVGDKEKSSTIDMNNNSGFEVGDGSDLTLEYIAVINAKGNGGSVIDAQGTDADINLKNVTLMDNTSDGDHGGAIYSNSDVNITTDDFTSYISGNTANGKDEAIYLDRDAKLTINTVNNGNIVINDKIATGNSNDVAITGDETGNVYLNNTIDNAKVTMDNVTLNLSDSNHFETSDFTINSGVLNLVNDRTQDQVAKSFVVNGDFKLNADVDLNGQVMDRLPVNTVVNNNAFIHVDKLNLTSDTTSDKVAIPFAYRQFKGNVDYIGPKVLGKSTQLTKLYAPIYKYSVSYEERDDMGYFVFGKGAGTPTNDYGSVNPAIMTSSVATQVGGYFNQIEALHDGFYHMERYTKYARSARLASENLNKYAIAEGSTPYINRGQLPETSQAMWTKPYTTFEKVKLHNGPKVSNTAYGAFYGGDTDLTDLGRGWKGIMSAFVGYNGNHMSYDGISMNMQGGALGATATFYKGNFFTGITASVGASAGEANTMYGNDHFTMLTGGVANKTGYDIEFKNGAIILQPSLFTGYTFVNTFDYTNAAGVRLDSDALHAIQVIPGIKIIGNTKEGWQPYAGVNMVWNIMDKTHVMANDAKLPQLSVKPYVEYGVGLQKSWGESFTAFGQAMLRNGGRNGIALSAGLRWIIGKDKKNKIQKVENPEIKPVEKSQNNGTKARKVLKQIVPSIKNAKFSTRTTMNAKINKI